MKKIVIIGAGPGGTASAMILAHRGYDVTVLEKNASVGGRNANIQLGDYSFDTGPTFLHTPFLIQEIFDAAGEKIEDHLDLVKLAPFNKIVYKDISVECHTDPEKMKQEIAEKFSGNERRFDEYLKKERKLNEVLFPCLTKPYQHWWQLLHPDLLKAAPHVFTRDSVYSKLKKFFPEEKLRMCMSFQTKYLGMTPWKCPGFLSILSSWEYLYGVYHIQGGICKLSESMANIAKKKGANIQLNSEVKKCHFKRKKITHVQLTDGTTIPCDAVIANADYAYSMTHLLGKKNTPRKKMEKKPMSCSTYMLYLGLDTIYKDEPHHQILMADDYKAWTNEINDNQSVPDDMAVYVRNSCVTDPHVAPKGKSGLYILVPVPNNLADHEWKDIAPKYREQVLDRVIERTGMKDLRERIVIEKCITPDDWESDYHVFNGATFSLRHTLNQMLYFRPHNQQSQFKNLYLTGGGTHPGSGIIPIIQSALISCDLIEKKK